MTRTPRRSASRTPLVAVAIAALVHLLGAPPAVAQLKKLKGLLKHKELVDKIRPMSADEERALGASVGHRLKSNLGVVDDAGLQRYVNMVGLTVARRVAAREGFPFRFIVLDADYINAFSVPGGDIYVTRGLVSSVTSEAQLAGVLGHEIHHSIERHAAKAVEKSDRWKAVGDAAVGDRTAVFQALTDAATSVVLIGFGREEERDCDRAGLDTAAAAGYQAEGLAEFLAILEADSRKSGNKNRGGLLGSHPEVGARIEALRERIASGALTGGARLADRYHSSVPGAPADKTLAALLAGTGGNIVVASDSQAEEAPAKKKKFGLGRLKRLAGFDGDSDASTDDRSSSAAVRGVGETEFAEGSVAYTDPLISISAAELDAFMKEGGLPA